MRFLLLLLYLLCYWIILYAPPPIDRKRTKMIQQKTFTYIAIYLLLYNKSFVELPYFFLMKIQWKLYGSGNYGSTGYQFSRFVSKCRFYSIWRLVNIWFTNEIPEKESVYTFCVRWMHLSRRSVNTQLSR